MLSSISIGGNPEQSAWLPSILQVDCWGQFLQNRLFNSCNSKKKLCWTTLMILFLLIVLHVTFWHFLTASGWHYFSLFLLPLRTGSYTSDELRLLVIAGILPTPMNQVLFMFAWCRQKILRNSTWMSQDLNHSPPSPCESALPPDHGNLLKME